MDNSTKIAVCSRSFSQNSVLKKELLQKFSNVKFNETGSSLSGEQLVDFLADVDGAVIALEYIDETLLSKVENLKFIGKYGVGLDKLDLPAMSRFGVKMGWTPGVNSRAVAELTLALSLDLVRKISESRQVVNSGDWTQIKGKQLSTATVGILGFGHVGSKVAALMNAFGAKVIANDKQDLRSVMQEQGVEPVDFETLIKNSDVLCLHIPHNVANHHTIGESEMLNMKPGSYIVNTARGGLIDENALLDMLKSGQIGGAALDVLEIEPPVNNALLGRDDVIVTSHIGGSSEEAILAMGRAAIDGLSNYSDAISYEKYL
ncbi:phosphoglycerate dehydrogenase [Aliiglaciecola aliphaticivorans]